jgi:hypothetical protein
MRSISWVAAGRTMLGIDAENVERLAGLLGVKGRANSPPI